MKNKFRLRYAPSPTGYLHIGNARTALFNFLLAKYYNGTFIVRIEDTDINRNVEGAIQAQFNDLKWLGIIPDESMYSPGLFGPYRQLKRLDIYESYAEQLVNDKLAYYCFCTPEELAQKREYALDHNIKSPRYSGKCSKLSHNIVEIWKQQKNYSIRFRVKQHVIYKYEDMIRGLVTFNSDDFGDFVIMKSNKIPTYNFAVVIDDHLMHISHVIRGEEHISNTPKQLMLYDAFRWEKPLFGHLTLIINDNGKKLSKRDHDVMQYISQFQKKGYLPEALFNFISLLGWSPEGEQEFFTMEELCKVFTDQRFSKAPGMFDIKKLNWMNSYYIKKMDDDSYYKFCYQFLATKYDLTNYSKNWINLFINLYKKELEYGEQINKFASVYLADENLFNKKAKDLYFDNKYSSQLVNKLFNEILELDDWTEAKIKALVTKIGHDLKLSGKNLFMPIRLLTTNYDFGPELIRMIFLLGKSKVLKNIKYVLISM